MAAYVALSGTNLKNNMTLVRKLKQSSELVRSEQKIF